MILNWKKTKQRIDNGELCYTYWSDRYRALVFIFCSKPIVVRTRRKRIIKMWKEFGSALWGD